MSPKLEVWHPTVIVVEPPKTTCPAACAGGEVVVHGAEAESIASRGIAAAVGVRWLEEEEKVLLAKNMLRLAHE